MEMTDLNDWKFVEELKSPLHQRMPSGWGIREARPDELRLDTGVYLKSQFPDGKGYLDTAYFDFNRFLDIADIKGNTYSITTKLADMPVPESYRISVKKDECVIYSPDTEGIRRGLIYLEDELMRSGGPFLLPSETERVPQIRTRISRCFFGPINRPPKNRDELADDINYYPEEYLNRLAHNGINGIWLTITFRDTCPSSIITEYGIHSAKRLEKLRLTVERCARYGIKVYVFCIEPFSLPANSPIFDNYPELRGHLIDDRAAFCISTDVGKAYVEEATRNLFSIVPGLGGMVVISVGERLSNCYSVSQKSNCPRCGERLPREVLADTLIAMEKGMHSVAPNAEMISWPYSQYLTWGDELTRDAAAYVPENVVLMQNFESAGGAEQLGKWRRADDYWLSYIGPSDLYRDCAQTAVKNGNRIFAKLQVGCSHEVATVPFVPVPGNLYKKFAKMHELGVSGIMGCWYFGNYPSLMTKAAGELAFVPFPKTEDEFLLSLASINWGCNAHKVVEAWKLFQEAYSNYPLTAAFGYYGPMHDGPVWPLYLEPGNIPLAPTWKIEFPTSGDRIGECMLFNHTLEEVIILCTRMAETWELGVDILKGLSGDYVNNEEQLRDICVAEALGLQFSSGLNILKFYSMREDIAEKNNVDKLTLLDQMEAIARGEIVTGSRLRKLAENDSRLGFHSEAEGYKYSPEKLSMRIRQLEELLHTEFPRVRKRLEDGLVPFPCYTGEEPQGKAYVCRRLPAGFDMKGKSADDIWDCFDECNDLILTSSNGVDKNTVWKAAYDDEAMYIKVNCIGDPDFDNECIELHMEPKRMWPFPVFRVKPDGTGDFVKIYISGFKNDFKYEVSTSKTKDGWTAVIKIPLSCLGHENHKPLRVNIVRKGSIESKWVYIHPLKIRLIYLAQNPEEFGWIIFD